MFLANPQYAEQKVQFKFKIKTSLKRTESLPQTQIFKFLVVS